ncbi:MAG: site-2 protease family protein, partial [Cellulomonas sp.]|nr:site-2 protease family protein [Cellulomonas sp.]
MAYVVAVLIVVVVLLASIGLHELGHMIPAKRFGVRVSQYMVGFGPTLWSRTRGETEYGLKAIPLGGYVRLV